MHYVAHTHTKSRLLFLVRYLFMIKIFMVRHTLGSQHLFDLEWRKPTAKFITPLCKHLFLNRKRSDSPLMNYVFEKKT